MLAAICLRRPKHAIDLLGKTDKINKMDFTTDKITYYNSVSPYITGCLQEEVGPPVVGAYATILTESMPPSDM